MTPWRTKGCSQDGNGLGARVQGLGLWRVFKRTVVPAGALLGIHVSLSECVPFGWHGTAM